MVIGDAPNLVGQVAVMRDIHAAVLSGLTQEGYCMAPMEVFNAKRANWMQCAGFEELWAFIQIGLVTVFCRGVLRNYLLTCGDTGKNGHFPTVIVILIRILIAENQP